MIFAITAVVFALSAGEPSAFTACDVRYDSVDVDKVASRSGVERFYPHGTRDYLGAPIVFYVVSAPRHSTFSVAEGAEFRCTGAGLAIRDVRSASFVVYPRGSRISRERSSTHYLVKPGQPMPRDVREGLRSGKIHYYKTL
jgi:hypothetical protein